MVAFLKLRSADPQYKIVVENWKKDRFGKKTWRRTYLINFLTTFKCNRGSRKGSWKIKIGSKSPPVAQYESLIDLTCDSVLKFYKRAIGAVLNMSTQNYYLHQTISFLLPFYHQKNRLYWCRVADDSQKILKSYGVSGKKPWDVLNYE